MRMQSASGCVIPSCSVIETSLYRLLQVGRAAKMQALSATVIEAGKEFRTANWSGSQRRLLIDRCMGKRFEGACSSRHRALYLNKVDAREHE